MGPGGSKAGGMMPPGIGGSVANQQQHPMYRGYSPSKPKWKGSSQQSQNQMMLGNPGSTGFGFNPQQPSQNNSMLPGSVMMASGFPLNPSSIGNTSAGSGGAMQRFGGGNPSGNNNGGGMMMGMMPGKPNKASGGSNFPF